MKIKKDDTVKVMKGKDVGKQGRVLKVLLGGQKVVVEGVNIFKKHIKGNGKDKESAIVDIVKPISTANVMVVCNSCGKPTRIGIKVENGRRIRFCKKCGKSLEISTEMPKTEVKNKKESKGKVIKKTVKSKKLSSKSKKPALSGTTLTQEK